MKTLLPVVFVSLLISGCSAAYKTGQTPDDVYYSRPAKSEEIVKSQKDPEYQSYFQDPDDNYLRMKVQNGGRWNTIDDYDYWYGYSPYASHYSPYYGSSMSFSFVFGNPWMYSGYYSPYYPYMPYYSPVYYPVVIHKQPVYYGKGYHPNLNGYNNQTYDRGGSIYRPSQKQSSYRSIFNTPSGTSPSRTYDSRPSRTFSTPSGGSFSSPSSGGGGGGGRSSGGGGGGRGGRGG